MNLPDQWHPLEVIRKLRAVWSALIQDQDMRFSEVRQRLALQLETELNSLSLPLTQQENHVVKATIELLRHDTSRYSFFDWALLMEASEAYLHSHNLIVCAKLSHSCQHPRLIKELQRTQTRLREVQNLVGPRLTQSLAHRWQVAGFSEELSHFQLLLSSSQPK
jgi:hypothetical protein